MKGVITMKYSEMLGFLKKHDIKPIQAMIAEEVTSQLRSTVRDSEFNDICVSVYNVYLDCVNDVDIWYLVDEELTSRGLKGE